MTEQDAAQNSSQSNEGEKQIKGHSKRKAAMFWLIGILSFFGLGWLLIWGCRHLDPPKDTEIGIPAVLVYVTMWAIVTQIIVSRMQWKAMQEGLQETRNILRHTERAFEMTERPIVIPVRASVPVLHADARLTIKLAVRNEGRTGAKRVAVWFNIATGKLRQYPGKRGNPKVIPFLAGNGTDEELTLSSRLALTPKALANVQSGTEQLTIYGEGYYFNVARDREYWIPPFAFEWDGNLNCFTQNSELPFLWKLRENRKDTEENTGENPN